MKKKLPLSLLMIRGSIGKKFVIKHYRWGVIKTKFPDMSKIVASKKQRVCRNAFRDAVAYAKSVIADPVLKAAWQKRLRRPNGVFNEAIKVFMRSKEQAERIMDSGIEPACMNKKSNSRLWIVFKNIGAKKETISLKDHIATFRQAMLGQAGNFHAG